jgi:hypothetical protein
MKVAAEWALQESFCQYRHSRYKLFYNDVSNNADM